MDPDDEDVFVLRPVEDTDLPGSGSALVIRQRKGCARSSLVGALKAVCLTPCGSKAPTTYRMIPPLPEVSIPCTTSRSERFRSPLLSA